MNTLTAHPKALIDALAAVKPAVGSRSAVAALSGVRVTAGENLGELIATDMEVAVRRLVPGETTGALDTVVSHADLAKALARFAKRDTVTLRTETMPGEVRRKNYLKIRREDPLKPAKDALREARADITSGGIDLTVSDGQRTIELHGLRYVDFPSIDFGSGEPWFDAPGKELAELIARATTFASKDETRPILTGLHLNPGEKTLCATDSYRLGIFRLPTGWVRPEAEHANVPARCLKVAAKTIKASSGVALRLEAHAVHIHTGDCDWRMRTIDGQYPNYTQLWPDFAGDGYADVELALPVPELLEACETATAFAQHNAPLRLNVNGGVKVHGRTPDRCSFSEVLRGATIVRNYHGEEFEIGFNPDFVRDIAKIANNGSLTLCMKTPLRPGAFLDGEDRYLLMPIRLNV
jgi:DNA polymerase-3 subunit beta